MKELRLKQGTTLALDLIFQTDDGGATINVSAATISSQIRDAAGDMIAQLPVAMVSGQPWHATILVASTASWPIGVLHCDIKVTMAGTVLASDTFAVIIDRGVSA